MEIKTKNRPTWHINAKWVVGLVLLPVFAITFLAFNLYLLTNRENGIPASANLLSALYSPNSNIAESLISVRQTIEKSADKSFSPFPDKSIKITEEDLNKYSPEELKGKLFTQLAASIYDSDESVPETVGLLIAFTKTGHAYIQKILLILLPVALALMLLAVYFSYGFGRLATPGVMAILIGAPGALLLTLLQKSDGQAAVPGADASWTERILFIVRSLAPQFEALRKNYLWLTYAGIALIGLAIIGGIARKFIKRKE